MVTEIKRKRNKIEWNNKENPKESPFQYHIKQTVPNIHYQNRSILARTQSMLIWAAKTIREFNDGLDLSPANKTKNTKPFRSAYFSSKSQIYQHELVPCNTITKEAMPINLITIKIETLQEQIRNH